MNTDKAIACIKKIGFKPRISYFEDRLIIQKTIYLLEKKGIKMDFNYSLYIRGPYSPRLTKELYDKQENIEKLRSNSSLTKKDKEILAEFKEIFGELKPSILEVASTYAYFAYEKKENPLTATRNVRKMKNFCTETQIALGISKAKQFLYQPTEKEINEMKKEHEQWENISLEKWE